MRSLSPLLLALCVYGCGSKPSSSPPPGPPDPPVLEPPIGTETPGVAATVSRAVAELAAGRVDDARALLSRTDEALPGDPSVPLLLAVADERSGDLLSARTRYGRYSDTHYGVLARRAQERLLATTPAQIRLETRDLLRRPIPELPPVDPDLIAVVPLARFVEEGGLDAESAAVGALVASNLSSNGWQAVDATRVRVLLDEMDLAGTARADLSVGLEVARRLGAGRVLQGTARRVALDTIEWNVTVTSVEARGTLQVDVFSLSGGTEDVPLMQQRLAAMVRTPPGRSVPSSDDSSSGSTLNPAALEAFGSGLLAMDRGNWVAAHPAFLEAATLDPQFSEAVALADLAGAAQEAPTLDVLIAEATRIGGLQRAVQRLRRAGSRAEESGGGPVGGGGRAFISDMLGLDGLSGGVLIDVTLTIPGGGR